MNAKTKYNVGVISAGMIARQHLIVVDMNNHPNDGYALIDHFIRVLDGIDEPIITLEVAKKHMDIIIKCCQFTDNSV